MLELLGRISDDLHFVRLLLTRLSHDSFLKDLELVASTSERQEMWRLADGTRSTEDIAKQIGVSARSVQYFTQDAEKRGIMSFIKRGYPKRPDYFDEIPSTWKPFKKQQTQTTQSIESQPQGEMTNEQQ